MKTGYSPTESEKPDRHGLAFREVDKTAIELFLQGVVELQTSQPLLCEHIAEMLE